MLTLVGQVITGISEVCSHKPRQVYPRWPNLTTNLILHRLFFGSPHPLLLQTTSHPSNLKGADKLCHTSPEYF